MYPFWKVCTPFMSSHISPVRVFFFFHIRLDQLKFPMTVVTVIQYFLKHMWHINWHEIAVTRIFNRSG